MSSEFRPHTRTNNEYRNESKTEAANWNKVCHTLSSLNFGYQFFPFTRQMINRCTVKLFRVSVSTWWSSFKIRSARLMTLTFFRFLCIHIVLRSFASFWRNVPGFLLSVGNRPAKKGAREKYLGTLRVKRAESVGITGTRTQLSKWSENQMNRILDHEFHMANDVHLICGHHHLNFAHRQPLLIAFQSHIT